MAIDKLEKIINKQCSRKNAIGATYKMRQNFIVAFHSIPFLVFVSYLLPCSWHFFFFFHIHHIYDWVDQFWKMNWRQKLIRLPSFNLIWMHDYVVFKRFNFLESSSKEHNLKNLFHIYWSTELNSFEFGSFTSKFTLWTFAICYGCWLFLAYLFFFWLSLQTLTEGVWIVTLVDAYHYPFSNAESKKISTMTKNI